MDQGQSPQREYPNLTHGQEWVTFYESFDRLVQDHLARSSDLLRRAMSLPEVAEREVAQVRTELESRLAAERAEEQALLAELRNHIMQSHTHASTLALSLNQLMTDLSALTQRVDSALGAARLVGVPATMTTGASTATSMPIDGAGMGAAATAMAGQETGAEAEVAESPPIDAAPSMSDAPVMPEELVSTGDELPMASAESDEAGGGIDLSAIAEAEEATGANETQTATAEGGEGGESAAASGEATTESPAEPQRPHWLSVTRIGSSRP